MAPRSIPLCITLLLVALLAIPSVQAVPEAPEALRATAGNGYADLSWLPVDGAERYLLYRGDMDGMAMIANLSAPFTAFHDAQVEEGESYLYYVTAVVGGEEGAPSNTVAVTVPEEERDFLLPVLALVISVIAIQVCVVMLLYQFKSNFRLK